MKQIGLFLFFLMIFFVSGCDIDPGQQNDRNSSTTEQSAVSEQVTPAPDDVETEVVEESAPPEEPAPKTEVREVQIGDDKRGHYEKHEFIAAPIGVYFRATQGMELERITAAMNLYKAMNDNKPPATEEIFMKEVIEANRIKLPQLKEGWKYLYEPETGKLMVEKPVD